MRCPCPLFRVSWAQPKGDGCRCHCPLPEGPGINLQPMFPPARGFHKGETGDVELRQPHSGGPPGSGDCNSKSQRGGVFRGGEHTLTILKVRLPLVGCVGVVAMESRPLCNLINVVAQALSLTPRPHKAACIVDGVLPSIICFSWVNSQWRLRNGFSRTLPHPGLPRPGARSGQSCTPNCPWRRGADLPLGKSGRPSG